MFSIHYAKCVIFSPPTAERKPESVRCDVLLLTRCEWQRMKQNKTKRGNLYDFCHAAEYEISRIQCAYKMLCLPACLCVCIDYDEDGAKTNFRRPNGNTRGSNFIYDIFVIFILHTRPTKMNMAGRAMSKQTTMISKCVTHRSEKETEAWPKGE